MCRLVASCRVHVQIVAPLPIRVLLWGFVSVQNSASCSCCFQSYTVGNESAVDVVFSGKGHTCVISPGKMKVYMYIL